MKRKSLAKEITPGKRQRTSPPFRALRLIRIPERDNCPIRAEEKYHYPKYSIQKSLCSIGRSKENHLQIANFPDSFKTHHISRKHALLVFDNDGEWILKNLGRWGTGLNGEVIGKNQSAVLHHGDEIMFGFYDFGGLIDTRTKYGELRNMAHYRVEFLDQRGAAIRQELEKAKKNEMEMKEVLEVQEKKNAELRILMEENMERQREMLEESRAREEERVMRLKANHETEMKAAELLKEAEIRKVIEHKEKEKKAKVQHLLKEKKSLEKSKQDDIQKLKKDHEKKLLHLENTSECSICLCRKVFPVSTKCGHTFCKKCIFEWKSNSQQCPQCRKKLKINKAVVFALMESIECLAEGDEEYMERKIEHEKWLRKKRLK